MLLHESQEPFTVICSFYSSSCSFHVTHTLIISIIIRHQLALHRPVSPSSNSLFKRLPNLLRPFGLIFDIILILYCFSFLSHVAAILTSFFLVSCQLVVLSTLTNSLHSFVVINGYTRLFFCKTKFISKDVSRFSLPPFYSGGGAKFRFHIKE